LRILQSKEISFEDALKMEDPALDHLLRSPSKHEEQRHQDFLSLLEYSYAEANKPHVTKQLLWEEYKSENQQGCQYSRFCYYLQLYDRSQKAVIVQQHHPGDKLFLDFAGDKLS
jgi:transposase